MRTIEELSLHEKQDLVREILDKKSGVSSKEWSDIIIDYDLDVHPDTLRRAAIGVKLMNDCESSDDGYIERQKQRELAKSINTMYRTEARSELLRESVIEAAKIMKPISFGKFHLDDICGVSKNGKSLVIGLGDLHYGADIHVKGLRGEDLNVYNSEVFFERMNRLLDDIIKIDDHEEFGDIHVMLVGDLIDGILRQSQLMRLEFGLVEQTIRLSETLTSWIDALWEHTGRKHYVYVHAVTGNHSEIRPLKAKAREFQDENLEKIVFWFMKERLRDNPMIEIDDDCNRMKEVTVEGYHFVLLHGDGENSITDIARNAVNLYGYPIDYFICGHLHKVSELPSGYTPDGNSTIIRVPSLCGMDSYAQSKGYGGYAGATAMIIEKGYGRRCVYPIKLQ